MRYGLQAYEDSTATVLVADWSDQAENIEAGTGKNGYGTLTWFVPMSQAEAKRYYDALGATHVFYGTISQPVFVGRINYKRRVRGGLELAAEGYFAALDDVVFTGIWSTIDYRRWRVVPDEQSGYLPSRWNLRNDDRLYFAPKTGQAYTSGGNRGSYYIILPGADREFKEVRFTYDVSLRTNWKLELYERSQVPAGGTATSIWSVTTSGSSTATVTLTGTAPVLEFRCSNLTGAGDTENLDDGGHYAVVTDLRVLTVPGDVTTGEMFASEVVEKLQRFVNGFNPLQILDDVGWLENPGLDINELTYEDTPVGKAVNLLLDYGDDQTPPRLWEAVVWDDNRVRLTPRGAYGLQFYTDVLEMEVNATLQDIFNEAYGLYTDGEGVVQRTADADDTASQRRYGIIRRAAVRGGSGSSTEAAAARDAYLEAYGAAVPRATIRCSKLFNAGGAEVPVNSLRKGDTLTLRNIGDAGSQELASIQTFVVQSTRYYAKENIMVPQPEKTDGLFELLVAG